MIMAVMSTETRSFRMPRARRMTVANGLFSGPGPAVPDELYITVQRGEIRLDRRRILLAQHSAISTNTYFGRFPASGWQQCTDVAEVQLEVRLTGAGHIALCAEDAKGRIREMSALEVRDCVNSTIRLSAKIDPLSGVTALWFEAATEEDGLQVEGLAWTVPAHQGRRPTHLVVCTADRAGQLMGSLLRLARDQEALGLLDAIHIVDQGTARLDQAPGFTRLAEGLGPKLRYRRQSELDPVWGLTRGMLDAGPDADVLLLADDMVLEPDSLVRLIAFAANTSAPVLVRGQQVSPGTDTSPPLPEPDRPLEEAAVDRHPVQDRKNLWACCLIPAEVIADVGLPLPMASRWSDVEFGLRVRRGGHRTVTLPGTALWQLAMPGSELREYYELRNRLITSALHGEFKVKKLIKELRRDLYLDLAGLRYAMVAMRLKAVEDFLLGPNVLAGNLHVREEVRVRLAPYPDAVTYPVSSIPDINPDELSLLIPGPAPERPGWTLGWRLLRQFVGARKGSAAVREREAQWWLTSTLRTVVVTDATQTGAKVRRLNAKTHRRLYGEIRGTLRRLRSRAPDVRTEFEAALPKLTSRTAWAGLLGKDSVVPIHNTELAAPPPQHSRDSLPRQRGA
ncbi:glycosyltransferase family 2 protein [Pseudonocardiaceae bacterium YIM PH 21723]|nr:glycosyltransferase family 2 protein [Pseudonocardiaceae bacterium YIM PH 21723]